MTSLRLMSRPSLRDTLLDDNLAVIGKMTNYCRWIFDIMSPYLGAHVLEAGCGNGNLSSLITEHPTVKRYVGIELAAERCSFVRNALKPREGQSIEILNMDLEGPGLECLASDPFDTIVCLNVLEHIQDDQRLLMTFHEILEPGGRVLLLAPAFQWLFGSIDEAVQHCRRYSRGELSGKLLRAGLKPLRVEFFNCFGILGWYWHGKVRRFVVHPPEDIRRWDRLVPALRLFERVLPVPFGLSIAAIAEKSLAPN
jgi:SAM-dependent methyltransferase